MVGVIFAPLCLSLLPSFDTFLDALNARRLARLDYVGAILSVGALVSLIMAISFDGTKYAGNSGQTIAFFCVSGVLFLVFAVQQRIALLTTRADRIFQVHFFSHKKGLLLFILAAAYHAAAFIPVYYNPIYFQFATDDSDDNLNVRLLAVKVVFSATLLGNEFLKSKVGHYQSWYLYTCYCVWAPSVVGFIRKLMAPYNGLQPIYV